MDQQEHSARDRVRCPGAVQLASWVTGRLRARHNLTLVQCLAFMQALEQTVDEHLRLLWGGFLFGVAEGTLYDAGVGELSFVLSHLPGVTLRDIAALFPEEGMVEVFSDAASFRPDGSSASYPLLWAGRPGEGGGEVPC